ncbi:MAG: hypothetical protein IT342_18710 [Candidatus Melainabacteria bacterium]|nr:hypothetical protein [Candidatus Melainabacteria bacterium]
MRKMKQRWHLEFSRRFAMLLVAAVMPTVCMQSAWAQGYAGPSFSGADSGSEKVPGMVGSAAAGSGYAHSAPNFWGNRGNGNSQPSNFNQAPAIGFEMGRSAIMNGGNNGSQTAVKLPAASCCGKATRNSAYYANDYMNNGYSLMGNAPGNVPGFNSNSVPMMSTAGGGAGFNPNSANGLAHSRIMQMRSAGSAGRTSGMPGQMSVPGPVAVPGQVPGAF